jgi:hypothetical protein
MTRSTITLPLALITAIAAAIAAPAAQADQGLPGATGKSEVPDAIDRYMGNHPPAPLDQCDLICRYLRNHPDGRATTAQAGSYSGRVPHGYPPFRPADI